MWEISQIICLGMLLLLSVIDIRYKKVPLILLIVSNLGALWYQCVMNETDTWLLFMGFAVGILFFFISRVSREGIGYGDSWGIMVLGIFMGIWGVLEVLAASFLLLILAGIVCMLRGKLNRKSTLPFFPFLTAGYVMVVFLGGL